MPTVNMTRMCTYAFIGYTDTIRKLLDDHPEVINQHSKDGSTLLLSACRGGRVATVELLIERGADVSITDSNNSYNSLQCATHAMVDSINAKEFEEKKEDYYRIIEMLLKKDIALLANTPVPLKPSSLAFMPWVEGIFKNHPEILERIQRTVVIAQQSKPKHSGFTGLLFSLWSKVSHSEEETVGQQKKFK